MDWQELRKEAYSLSTYDPILLLDSQFADADKICWGSIGGAFLTRK